MDTILFRGKSVDNGEWVRGWPIRFCDGLAIIIEQYVNAVVPKNKYVSAPCTQVAYETVGQYTGLKDRNGKLIFEGDIIKTTEDGEPIYAVEWGGKWGYPAFDTSPQIEHCDCNCLSYLANDCCYGMEVVGNIHDNPELLNQSGS